MPETADHRSDLRLPTKQQLVTLQVATGQHGAAGDRGLGTAAEVPGNRPREEQDRRLRQAQQADAVLRDHDRVEIYRPLIADPKEVRKQRAAAGKVMKKGAGDGE
jgi:hypothetical protein